MYGPFRPDDIGLVTAGPIACATCLGQGIAQLRATIETGGAVLDAQSLALDGMLPERFRINTAQTGRASRGVTVTFAGPARVELASLIDLRA